MSYYFRGFFGDGCHQSAITNAYVRFDHKSEPESQNRAIAKKLLIRTVGLWVSFWATLLHFLILRWKKTVWCDQSINIFSCLRPAYKVNTLNTKISVFSQYQLNFLQRFIGMKQVKQLLHVSCISFCFSIHSPLFHSTLFQMPISLPIKSNYETREKKRLCFLQTEMKKNKVHN